MTVALRARLVAVPDALVPVAPAVVDAIADSRRYLASDAALRSLALDPYWPKWDSPWWHMLLLFELGEERQVPERIARAMTTALEAMPVKIFPTRPEDVPPGIDVHRQTSCHCALGSMSQVLAAAGIDVERELPWVKPWFGRYQMADGGLNCDGEAYNVTTECPSSMVGTIAPFEAMLRGDPSAWSAEQAAFVARAATFLMGRELRLGSSSRFNADERAREPAWRELCFPRFYFYDVLRGLAAIVRWAELCNGALPLAAIDAVTTDLCERFPDGVVQAGRQSYAGIGTRAPAANGEWIRREASTFPLLESTSTIGAPSPWLTRVWTETRASLIRSIDAGRVVG